MINNQGVNPYLPSWEYVPDGEPHVFGDRVYVYGSHDFFNGVEFCPGDYVCYSADVKDLRDWRFEGVIYGRSDDPRNKNGEMCLYAPDVTQGPDGRYYLYYCLHMDKIVSVAVCDEPGGRYEFLGYVHYPDGTILGEGEQDEFQFDPGVLTEGDTVYLYTGFCIAQDTSHHGAMCTILEPDMLTIHKAPVFVAPSAPYSAGTGFEGHEFFEASSIRKVGDTYYFVYSSIWNTEMCYATSKYPDRDFVFRGVIVDNIDRGIGTYKDPAQPMGYRDNNHGGFECINGRYYMFYHRQTNNYSFSRQTCFEPIRILEDGSIPQVEITSSGPNGGPLAGEGTYPAYIACHVYRPEEIQFGGGFPGVKKNPMNPYLTQEGKDGDENPGYVENMNAGAFAGFRYFQCDKTVVTDVQVRMTGFRPGATLEVVLGPFGEAIGAVDLMAAHDFSDGWAHYNCEIPIPDGVQALYFRAAGPVRMSFGGFTLSRKQA